MVSAVDSYTLVKPSERIWALLWSYRTLVLTPQYKQSCAHSVNLLRIKVCRTDMTQPLGAEVHSRHVVFK